MGGTKRRWYEKPGYPLNDSPADECLSTVCRRIKGTELVSATDGNNNINKYIFIDIELV